MSGTLVDVNNEPGDLAALEKDLSEAVTTQATADKATQATKPATTDSPAVPEKYEGKSLQDVVDMHRNLESAYGRMANDLGTQRKLTDQLLELKRTEDLNQNPAAKPVEVSSTEILDNPTGALDKYFESRESQIAAQTTERLAQMEAALAQDRFTAKHSDYNEIANDPEFVAWLQATPYRSRAAQLAVQGDWNAADELMTEFKEIRAAKPAGEGAPATDPNLEAARAASLESSGTAGGQSTSSGKVYRRADLVRLKLEKPKIYGDPQFQQEIMQAYAEGRVK